MLFMCGYLRAVLNVVLCGEENRREETHEYQKSRVESGFHLGTRDPEFGVFSSASGATVTLNTFS